MFGRSFCGHLLELEPLTRIGHLNARAAAGLLTIPIAAIVGTVGRCCDFDRCFNVIRPHLRHGVSAVRDAFGNGAFPVIDVFKVGAEYFVSDGHKRVAAARAAGAEFIDANVTEIFAINRG